MTPLRRADRPDTLKDTASEGLAEIWVDPLLAQLFPQLSAPGARWGLHKTRSILESVGNPHTSFDSIHVGGTNGKGSVSALIASVLSARDRRVGLYTSPHLVRFAERIQIDGAPLSDARLLELAGRLRESVVQYEATFFEATTALAFHAFAEHAVDIAVVEVGLGGRLDATNVIDPLVTVITNIGMDHAQFLGDTLVQIAAEKAGIIKPGVPVVTGVTDPAVLDVIASVAAERGAPLHSVSAAHVHGWYSDGTRTHATLDSERWGPIKVQLALNGPHQALNAAVALRALELLNDRVRPTRDEAVRGLGRARWPGRFDRRTVGGRTWTFDVGHNLPGIEAMIRSGIELGVARPWICVMGVLDDKDWGPMASRVAQVVDALVLTVPPSSPAGRRWDPDAAAVRIRAALAPGRTDQIEVVHDFASALERVADLASAHDTANVFVTGSCHTVGDAFLQLGIPPFGDIVT